MKMKYISQIASNLKRYKTIRTNRATSQILDGSYRSLYKGRSMNFDELREYVPGDDIKDIDWKASARNHPKLLVKQYIAEKKHNIMLVLDTNKRMLANASDTEEKRQVALLGAGTLAYLINQNGDYTGAIFPTEQSLKHFPFKTGLINIENILEHYDKSVTMTNQSNINTALDYIVRNFRRNMILIVVTDLQGIRDIPETTLKRLMVMNDVLMLNVSDATMFSSSTKKTTQDETVFSSSTKKIRENKTLFSSSMGKTKQKASSPKTTNVMQKTSHRFASHIQSILKPAPQVYSLEQDGYLPEFFTKDKKLAKLQEEKQDAIYDECVDKLKRYGISFTTINHTQEIDETIIELLTTKHSKK